MVNVWWNQVTNAVNYVADIKQAILSGQSIIINNSEEMPWRSHFKETVIETVKLYSSDKKFIDIPVVSYPGEYLLNELCKKEKRAEYRPTKGYAKFFADNDDIVLHDRFLWVQVEELSKLEDWISFISEYIQERKKRGNTAVFIIEWRGVDRFSKKKGVKTFSFDDYIGEYDRIVFAVLASSSIREKPFIKHYIAELAANVVGNDIELCAECLRRHKEFIANPVMLIQNIVDKNVRSDEKPFTYNKTSDEVEHMIWLSQIKTIYPFIEEYRETFVEKYASDIQKQLPISSVYGETYTDPKDVELGSLIYMAGNGFLRLESKEYERLYKFKEARNKLSHLTQLSINEINDLI